MYCLLPCSVLSASGYAHAMNHYCISVIGPAACPHCVRIEQCFCTDTTGTHNREGQLQLRPTNYVYTIILL